MIRLPGANRCTPIGVCYDERSITAAQLAAAPGGWQLTAAADVPRSASDGCVGAPEARSLVETLARRGFRGRRVVLAAPPEKTCCDVLDMPPRSSGAPLEELATAELARMHNYDPEAAETVCWDLPASGRLKDVTQVMAVACRHEDANSLLEGFEAAGLVVLALDSYLDCVARACRPRLSGTGLTAMLDLDWPRAVLSLHVKREMIYQRTLADASLKGLAATLGGRLGLDADSVEYVLWDVGLQSPEGGESDAASMGAATDLIRGFFESILAELTAPLSYAAHQYPGVSVDGLLLTGRGAAMPGVAGLFHTRLSLPVHTATPADAAKPSPSTAAETNDPALTAAVGLALYADTTL